MRRRVAVTRVEAVTALGEDLASTVGAVAEGTTAFTPVTGFDVSSAVNDRAAQWRGRRSAAEVLTAVLDRVAAESGPLAVDRAYFAGTPDEPPPDVPGVVVRPAPGGAPGGWDRVYTGACVSSSSALVDAAAAVAHGWCDRVLVAAARGLDRETFHVFSAGGAMTREPWMRPLVAQRSGVLLGEGAAVLVVEAEGLAGAAAPVAELRGWGRAGDAFHPFRPDPEGRGMARALRQALAGADLATDRIGLVSVHGTATEPNDAAEVAALTDVFGVGSVPAVHACKASVGHTLEACGLVETAVAVGCLAEGLVPPTPGIRPDGVPLVRSVAAERGLEPGLSHVASLNLAFGGCNTAVILSRWDGRAAPARGTAERRRAPALRLRSWVGIEPEPAPVPGFLRSEFPAAVHDAADRCLGAAGLTEAERDRTAVVVLAPEGDAATKAAVRACLDAGRRPPPPLFVQSTPASVIGLIAKRWHLRGGVNVLASARALDDVQVTTAAAEMAAAEDVRAVLVVRHLPAAADRPGGAEAAVYSR